jgi:hypothetical protein
MDGGLLMKLTLDSNDIKAEAAIIIGERDEEIERLIVELDEIVAISDARSDEIDSLVIEMGEIKDNVMSLLDNMSNNMSNSHGKSSEALMEESEHAIGLITDYLNNNITFESARRRI